MKCFVFAVAALIGCGAPVELPGQSAAVSLVWRDHYGAPLAEAPPVFWHWDRCPTSPDGPAAVLWTNSDGATVCLSGLYTRGVEIDLAWRGGLSDSALAHELMHALQWRSGIDDPDHTRTDDWARAADANTALRDAGF